MAGKGDKPRSCFSAKFKNNYENINWGSPKFNEVDEPWQYKKKRCTRKGKTIQYYK